MTLTGKEQLEYLKERNHERYVQVLELDNIIQAIRRIFELQPVQSDKSLLNTDARIEYTALMRIVHDLAWGENTSGNLRTLDFWINNRQIALTMVAFNEQLEKRESPPNEHVTTLNSILRAQREQQARNLDQATIDEALRLIENGTIMEHAIIKERSQQATDWIESNTPIDVRAFVRERIAETVPATV